MAAYSYMALVPIIQPPIMKLLTTKKERLIRMKPLRVVSKRKNNLPDNCFCSYHIHFSGQCCSFSDAFFRQPVEESGVTDRLANSAKTVLIDVVTILIGLTVGAKTTADVFLTSATLKIFLARRFFFCCANCCRGSFCQDYESFFQKQN